MTRVSGSHIHRPADVTTPRFGRFGSVGPVRALSYGYLWWLDLDRDAYFAWGFGGQYIFVFRELETVIVVTSSTARSDERFDYRRSLFDLIARHVLPVVAQPTFQVVLPRPVGERGAGEITRDDREPAVTAALQRS